MSTAQKCERCREYNAAAVDFRNQAANAQSDLAALLTRHNALVEATITALKFYAEEDAESVEDGILKSVFDRPATKALAALVGEEGK